MYPDERYPGYPPAYPGADDLGDPAFPFGDLEAPQAGAIPGGRPPPAVPFTAGDMVPAGMPPAYVDPRQVRPPDASDFIMVGNVNVAGPTPASTFVQVAQFTLPSGARGIIRDGSLSVAGTITLGTDVVFRLVVSGGVVPGWDNLTWAGRNAAALDQGFLPESTWIDVPESATVEVQVRVNDAGTYNCFATFHGWSWRG